MMRFLLCALLLTSLAAPARALDITYFDKTLMKEILLLNVECEENAEGITVKKANAYEIVYQMVGMTRVPTRKQVKLTFDLKLAPASVKEYRLTSDDVKPLTETEFRTKMNEAEKFILPDPKLKEAEQKARFEKAVAGFKELQTKLPAGSRAARYMDYRYADALYKLSQKDDALRPDAIAVLLKFQKEHATGWQTVPALEMLAKLQELQKDLEGMQKTYEILANVPGVGEEVRINSLLSSVRVLMKQNKYADARTRLNELQQKVPETSPLRPKVGIFQAQCRLLGEDAADAAKAEQEVRQLLRGTEDKKLKALAHNTLGEYLRKIKKDDDAFWEFMKVDTLYVEDEFELARAMHSLMVLYRDVRKESDRARAYATTLATDPRFVGLEYQKSAAKELDK